MGSKLGRRGLLVAWLASAAVGCATIDAVERGKMQLAAKDWEGAVATVRRAAQVDPDNVTLKTALSSTVDKAVAGLLFEAAAAREERPAAARDLYARVLALEPGNQRALAAHRGLDTETRQETMWADAARAAQAGRLGEARRRANALLSEVPGHARAKALIAQLDAAVKPEDQPGPTRIAQAYRKQVSLEFREAPLRNVFDILARETGINFVFDKDLNRNTPVTVFARATSFGQVLDNILVSHGLGSRILGEDSMLIYAAQPQKLREYQELLVHNFFLHNADARQIGALLRAIVKINDIYVDERRNLIVVRDTADAISQASKLVAAHDQPEPEVMLEVEVLEVKRSTLDELGVRFPDQLTLGVPGDVTLNMARALNGDLLRVTGLDKALILNLKRQAGTTDLLANPRIRVRNREKARIHIGDRVPVITSTISGVAAVTTESVSYLDVGIKLEVEPIIQIDDVQIRALLEVSSIVNTLKTNSGSTVYQLGTRNASTTLSLRDGETQILAGLIQRSERANTSRLPGLGDLPVVGRIFSSEASDTDKTEVLLSITPRIVRGLELPSDALTQFRAGPEASRRAAGGAPTPLPPPASVAPTQPPPQASQPQPAPLPVQQPGSTTPPGSGIPR